MPFAIIIIGASGIIAQIVLIRELLVNFQGNEFSIGFVIGNWLIAEALGSYIFRRAKLTITRYQFIIFAFALIFPILCFATRILRPILGVVPGEIITFPIMFLSSLTVLFPASFLHGALFTSTVSVLAQKQNIPQRKLPGNVYVLENIGTVIGGIILSFVLIAHLNSFQIAFIIGLLNIAVLIILKPRTFIYRISYYGLILLFIIALFFSPKIENWSLKLGFHNYKILASTNTIYSNITVIRHEEQYTFLVDRIPAIITPSPDQVFVEDFTHFPFLAHPSPKRILLISGGVGGVLNEMLKYPVKSINYVELDPNLIQMVRKFPTPMTSQELSDPRVKIINSDARFYLEKNLSQYDLILINFLMPHSLQINRFFSKEFYSICKQRLNPDGILVTLSLGSLSYISPNILNIINTHLKTLKSVFPEVLTIPGDINIYLSSSKEIHNYLNPDTLLKRILTRNIKSDIFSLGYINYRIQKYTSLWLNRSLENIDRNQELFINKDGIPRGLFYSIVYSNTIANPSLQQIFSIVKRINLKIVLFFIIIIFSVLLLMREWDGKLVYLPFAIFTTGIVGMVFSLVLSLGFQIRYGYLYYQISILITTFIAGSTVGGYIGTKFIPAKIKYFVLTEFLISLLLLLLIGTLINKAYPKIIGTQFDFFIFLFIAGLLVGIEFPLANRIYTFRDLQITPIVGKLYAADLLGGFLSAIIISAIFIPLLGIFQTLLLAFVLKVVSALLVLTAIHFSIE